MHRHAKDDLVDVQALLRERGEKSLKARPVLRVEGQALENLIYFAGKCKDALLQENMIQIPELMVAHLCLYLGFLTVVGLGCQEAVLVQSEIAAIVKEAAHQAYEHFLKPTGDSSKIPATQKKDDPVMPLSYSILTKTLKLGRVIFEILRDLNTHRQLKPGIEKKQTKLFCPPEVLIPLLTPMIAQDIAGWKNCTSIHDAIHTTAVQIGWLMGYYAHLDKTDPGLYLEQGLPCIPLSIEYGKQAPIDPLLASKEPVFRSTRI